MSARMSRRELLRWAAAAGAAQVLAACQPQVVEKEKVVEKEVTKIVPEVSEKVVTATPAPQTPVNLTVVTVGEGLTLQENVKPFTETHPNITVEIIGVPADGYERKNDLLIASGEPPALWYPLGQHDFTYYAVRDLLADNLPMVERESFALSDFADSALDPLYFRGNELVGLPSSNFVAFLAYNKNLFEEANVPLPPGNWDDESWTWEEFITRAQALTKPDPDPLKAVWGFGGGFSTPYLPQYFGATMWKPEDFQSYSPKTSQITSKPVVEAYQMAQDLIWKYKVQPDPQANSAFAAATSQSYFYSGKAAMSVVATWNVPGQLAAIKDFEWGMAPIPTNHWSGPRTILYAGVWVTFKHPHQDAVWELLKFFVSPEAIHLDIELQKTGNYDGGVTDGGVPGRISMGKEWASMVADITKLPEKAIEEINVNGMDYALIFQSLGTTKWGEVNELAMQPEVDKILNNKTTVEEAVQRMDQKINEVLAAE